MCGRFTLSKPEKIQKRFKTKNKLPLFEPSWNVSPSRIIPVITKNSPNQITMMKWGLVWKKNQNTAPINIRSESTVKKPFFKNMLLNKRCIIVSDSFYEWGEVDLEGKPEKYPFNFFLKGRKLFGFAGVYCKIYDAEGKTHYSCAILTTNPNNKVGRVHNRMPVILDRSNEEIWLDPKNNDFEKLFHLLGPYPDDQMGFYIVSKKVNNPRNDTKDLIKKYNPKS